MTDPNFNDTKVILCDLDGTLADSMGYLYEVYEAFMADKGLPSSREEFSLLLGPPIREVIMILVDRHGIQEDFDVLFKQYAQLINKFASSVPLMPGAKEFLEKLKYHNKYKLFIVTAAKRRYLEHIMELHNLHDYVAGSITVEDTVSSKPHPEPYLQGLRLADVEPDQAIAIEDTPGGVASATSAGVRTLWIGSKQPQGWKNKIYHVPDWEAITELLHD